MKHIIITSINPPTKAVKKYSKLPGTKLTIVGDKKSPKNYDCNNVDYLTLEKQNNLYSKLSTTLPLNHYSRKNIGYIHALKNNASSIIDTDDDNIPYDNYLDVLNNLKDNVQTPKQIKNNWINIYAYFTKTLLWPRGFPLDCIKTKPPELTPNKNNIDIAVWQGLADREPDLDAIYRLTQNNQDIVFDKRCPQVVLNKNQFCPVNSQNTMFDKSVFCLTYIPTTVTFRFCDILRGLVMQPILHLYNKHVGFYQPTVYQDRNPHDLFSDFVDEIPMYLHCKQIPQIISDVIDGHRSMQDNLLTAYQALAKHNIVKQQELQVLGSFLEYF